MLGRKLNSGSPKTKESQAGLERVVLFWKSHCVTCVPALLILYHVTGSCKGPIHKRRDNLRADTSPGRNERHCESEVSCLRIQHNHPGQCLKLDLEFSELAFTPHHLLYTYRAQSLYNAQQLKGQVTLHHKQQTYRAAHFR